MPLVGSYQGFQREAPLSTGGFPAAFHVPPRVSLTGVWLVTDCPMRVLSQLLSAHCAAILQHGGDAGAGPTPVYFQASFSEWTWSMHYMHVCVQ